MLGHSMIQEVFCVAEGGAGAVGDEQKGGGIKRESGIDTYRPLHIKQVNNKE